MSIYVFANNASSLLASSIISTDTTVTVTASEGSKFPTISAGQVALVTLEDVSGNKEIMKATARTGDALTVVRAQEGTTALAFASGSRVELRVTAGLLAALLQKNGGDVLSGTTTVTGVINLGAGGSIQGGEFAGPVRSAAGVTTGEIKVVGGVPKSGTATILTDANLVASLPSGVGVMQTGMICLWFGSSGSIPAGYHACDGTVGTPNLSDKFVLGAGGALPTSGGAASVTSGATIATGSADPHVLVTAEMPSHSHALAGLKAHVFSAGGGHATVIDTDTPSGSPSAGATTSVGGDGAHSHGFTGVAHTHSVAVLPPYTALFYIMKL